MGKRSLHNVLPHVMGAMALLPFVIGVTAVVAVCGAPLAPPLHDDDTTSAPPESTPDQHEKTQEVTYEPWELVST